MENTIKIKYRLDFNRLKETYFSAYGVTDDEYIKELDDSIPDRMRNIEAEFDDEKVIIKTVDKNEVNTYLYEEIYKIKKTKDSYLFFISNVQFFTFKFDDFTQEDLTKIDGLLKDCYILNQNETIAEIENYELNEKRVIEAGKTIYRSINIVFIILGVFLTVFHQIIYKNTFITLLTIVLYCIFIWFFLKFYYKNMAKKIIKSTNKNFLYARLSFYDDKLEVTAKRKIGMTKINYNEFYKIKKTKKGYLFLMQKYSFYFFFYDEFQKEELEKLNNTLSKYM